MRQIVRLHILFAAMGFAAMAAQILIMRRMIVCFGGNELVTGGVLAGWLGFSGLGNLIAGKFADRISNAEGASAVSLVLMSILIPATLIGTYFVKTALGLPPPAMVGLGTALLSAVLLLAPLGLAIGISFTIACRLPGTNQASDIARVYLFDALGAGLGGLLISIVALRYMTAMQSSLAATALLTAAVALTFTRRSIRTCSLILVALLSLAAWKADPIDSLLTQLQWRGYNPVVHRESLFATLMVTDNRGERTLFVDNRPSFSLPLPETYESIAFVPLLEHPDPEDVLMIEGGTSGVIDQWKKVIPSSAHFARLDPVVTALEYNDMPSVSKDLPPWAMIHHADGRRLIREGIPGQCSQDCFDLIIVNVGEPDTAAADRYYTVELFREAARALKPDGVLCLALMEPSNVVSSEVAALLGGIEATLRWVFPNTLLLPLDRYYFFASREPGSLTDELSQLSRRLDQRGIEAPFLRTQILPGIFPERIKSAQQVISSAAWGTDVDTDLHPHAYFNGLMLWERRAGNGPSPLAGIRKMLKPWIGAAMLGCLMLVSLIAARRPGRRVRMSVTWVLFATGFASIVYEIVLLVHYQMSVGLLIWKMGFIITAFMVGAGAGAWCSVIADRAIMRRRLMLIAALCISALYLPLLFITANASAIAANFGIGILTGFIYQLAAAELAAEGRSIGAVAAVVQNADLWGAAVGSLFASAVAVPLLGLRPSITMACAILLAALTIVLILRK